MSKKQKDFLYIGKFNSTLYIHKKIYIWIYIYRYIEFDNLLIQKIKIILRIYCEIYEYEAIIKSYQFSTVKTGLETS